MLEFVIGYSAGQRTATRSASLARSAAVADGTIHSNRIEDLNERIDKLAMIVRAMWELLEEQGMTVDQLMEKLDAIDVADGVDDDRVTALAVDCPECDSKVAPGLPRCQFCGADVMRDPEHPMGQL